jgi:hypothetical protein
LTGFVVENGLELHIPVGGGSHVREETIQRNEIVVLLKKEIQSSQKEREIIILLVQWLVLLLFDECLQFFTGKRSFVSRKEFFVCFLEIDFILKRSGQRFD